jgi:hypothetical protein
MRIFGTDFAGRLIAWNTKDGKKIRELDANPTKRCLILWNERLRSRDHRPSRSPLANGK